MKAAKDSNIIAVPGVEFTTAHAGKELHVVGLFIKEEVYQQVEDYCEPMRKAKEISNRLLIDNLKKAGYAVEYEEMVNYVEVDNINRAVIASYLIEKKIIKRKQSDYEYYRYMAKNIDEYEWGNISKKLDLILRED